MGYLSFDCAPVSIFYKWCSVTDINRSMDDIYYQHWQWHLTYWGLFQIIGSAFNQFMTCQLSPCLDSNHCQNWCQLTINSTINDNNNNNNDNNNNNNNDDNNYYNNNNNNNNDNDNENNNNNNNNNYNNTNSNNININNNNNNDDNNNNNNNNNNSTTSWILEPEHQYFLSRKCRDTMTSSTWIIFRVTDPFCGVFVTGEFPSQRPVARSFDIFLWSAPE